ncbi:SHOCT domain-containing protein [Aliarcobacter skirrowii]|uniref:SHOCT domain-containing protein n=1 Tax=Aliarcobacter skirrowii TaxID=28200 RepID=UPI0029A0297A|nr:SHOCT domain-containing protein [Aliarcobacter skirrowii]MDX4013240.1 SHOCT domain-containing protein [Aliarcobacter skirrowii]
MFCKECGTENSDNSLRCKQCNAYLKSSDSPLTGGDRTKIIAFFAFLILPFGWFGGSVIIILIAIFGLYIMKKDQSFTPIINAKKWMKVYLVVLALAITAIVTVVYYDENEREYSHYDKINKRFIYNYNKNINVETAMVAGAGLIATPIAVGFFMFIFNSLFFRPLEEHQNWITKNGVFSDEKSSKNDSTNIVGRDNFSSYSVADEMLKWNDLLEKGLITKEEFEKAKTKLMNGEKT